MYFASCCFADGLLTPFSRACVSGSSTDDLPAISDQCSCRSDNMIPLEAALFVVTIVICLADLALLFAASLFASTPCNSYETKFKDYKRARIAVYALVLVIQCSCTAARVGYHWPRLTLIDGCQLLVALSYAFTLVRACGGWD